MISFSTDTLFESKYTLRNKLQGGSYGTVYVGYHKVRKREYAVKVVNRR
jgi:serine/threonine protein kinase